MAVPKRKTTPSRRNHRRSHDALKKVFGTECKNCGVIRTPYNVCNGCGYYRGRKVF